MRGLLVLPQCRNVLRRQSQAVVRDGCRRRGLRWRAWVVRRRHRSAHTGGQRLAQLSFMPSRQRAQAQHCAPGSAEAKVFVVDDSRRSHLYPAKARRGRTDLRCTLPTLETSSLCFEIEMRPRAGSRALRYWRQHCSQCAAPRRRPPASMYRSGVPGTEEELSIPFQCDAKRQRIVTQPKSCPA